MTEFINYPNQQLPAITINVTGPTLNAPMHNGCCVPPPFQNNEYVTNPYIYPEKDYIINNKYVEKEQYAKPALAESTTDTKTSSNSVRTTEITENKEETKIVEENNKAQEYNQAYDSIPQAYPAEYYINNYSEAVKDTQKKPVVETANDMEKNNVAKTAENQADNTVTSSTKEEQENKTANITNNIYNYAQNKPEEKIKDTTDNDNLRIIPLYDNQSNMTASKEIIEEINERAKEQKELEKTGKKTKIVALTDEYIMSLENYLNNPNTEIRVMASKEVLKRLDEDKTRYDDAALNALINKMLQDPNKLVRVAAMSALSSDLASGNDYTIKLLTNIQQNPKADPEDVLEASQFMLKRSTSTEIRYVPQQQTINADSEKVEKE